MTRRLLATLTAAAAVLAIAVAKIYDSFDGGAVGVLQGKGVIAGLKANGNYSKHPVVAELNGGNEDANAHLFKSGYDSVLDRKSVV